MAILEEANLLAERARHAKHRTHHVGTKLNEHELHEFETLAEKRQQSPSELIRGLVLREIEQRDLHIGYDCARRIEGRSFNAAALNKLRPCGGTHQEHKQ